MEKEEGAILFIVLPDLTINVCVMCLSEVVGLLLLFIYH